MLAGNSKSWMQTLLQIGAILVAAWSYSTAQEHRLTLIEARIEIQRDFMNSQSEQMLEMQKAVSRLIALEEYIHHGPDSIPAGRH